jgi:hypothetical protein
MGACFSAAEPILEKEILQMVEQYILPKVITLIDERLKKHEELKVIDVTI